MTVEIPSWLISGAFIFSLVILVYGGAALILMILFNVVEFYYKRIVKQISCGDMIKFSREYSEWKHEKTKTQKQEEG